MSTDCCANPGIRASHSAKGHFVTIGGNSNYEVGRGEHVLIYGTDVFGNTFINAQRNADAFADAGFRVYIPDFFNGQPLNPTDPDLPTKIPLFRQNNPAPAASKYVKIVVDHLLQQSPPITSLSFIGFCYGAKPITVLLQSNPYIHSKTNVVVFNHPSSLTKEEADQWNKIPLHINEAETDQIFVPELRAHWERVLTEKKLGSFKLYPGTVHGFAARPQNEVEEKARQVATPVSIEFLKKHTGLGVHTRSNI